MKKIEVGKLFDEDVTRYREGCKFDITDSGAELYLYFNNVEKNEINDCKEGDLLFNFVKLDNIIFFIAKIGNMQTLDCPFSIHLSKNLTHIDYVKEGKGLALTIYLIEANTGILKSIRLIGLNSKFSYNLVDTIKEQGNEKFDISEYDYNLSEIYQKYSTKDLERMSRYYCRIKKD